ncbi:MAG: L-glyceraldehyde 3-phosphate reductase [Chitinophagaceae bacterium]|nr:L-glyceraldehyde 3-phosphate reductase [Chitinophagaceae bacterium]
MYTPDPNRYDHAQYNRCGKSGLLLPAISLGLWHNFGDTESFENGRKIIRSAFDRGVTHFDLANNYGVPPGSAEENFGKILRKDFPGYLRDELIISSKAGWRMWPGPYGEFNSRKYLVASLDQSLKRMGVDYVDIFYSHRPDPETPVEETMMALDSIVRSGKALYAGISSYDAAESARAFEILKSLGTPCLIHQPKYSMLDRWVEDGLLDTLEQYGVGCIVFSPLAQGLLSGKYLNGIPEDSRAKNPTGFLKESEVTERRIKQMRALNEIAAARGQSLSQMAIAWLLKDGRVTSVLVGVSREEQLLDNLGALNNLKFDTDELLAIEGVLAEKF